jgi:hypothetical protein
MDKKAFLFAALGVTVGAAVGVALNQLIQKLKNWKFELAEYPVDEDDLEEEIASALKED